MRKLASCLVAPLVWACAAWSQDAEIVVPAEIQAASEQDWVELADGLELRTLRASQPSRTGDELIYALRIEPEHHEFVLLVADAHDGARRTAREWAEREGLVAATNAGMFQATESALPVGFTRADGATLKPGVGRDRTMFVFGAESTGASDPGIIDRDCEGFDGVADDYANALQSIRMISCDGRNVWSQQPREWSTAAIAVDDEGRVLFVHVRSPYSVHDFINMLQAAPLGIVRAMYLEGGPEATLFARAGDVTVERVGSFETGFFESDGNHVAWPLPNVIGVRPRADEQALE